MMRDDYNERYLGKLNQEVEKLCHLRFSKAQGQVFEGLKRIFKYNKFKK